MCGEFKVQASRNFLIKEKEEANELLSAFESYHICVLEQATLLDADAKTEWSQIKYDITLTIFLAFFFSSFFLLFPASNFIHLLVFTFWIAISILSILKVLLFCLKFYFLIFSIYKIFTLWCAIMILPYFYLCNRFVLSCSTSDEFSASYPIFFSLLEFCDEISHIHIILGGIIISWIYRWYFIEETLIVNFFFLVFHLNPKHMYKKVLSKMEEGNWGRALSLCLFYKGCLV